MSDCQILNWDASTKKGLERLCGVRFSWLDYVRRFCKMHGLLKITPIPRLRPPHFPLASVLNKCYNYLHQTKTRSAMDLIEQLTTETFPAFAASCTILSFA